MLTVKSIMLSGHKAGKLSIFFYLTNSMIVRTEPSTVKADTIGVKISVRVIIDMSAL